MTSPRSGVVILGEWIKIFIPLMSPQLSTKQKRFFLHRKQPEDWVGEGDSPSESDNSKGHSQPGRIVLLLSEMGGDAHHLAGDKNGPVVMPPSFSLGKLEMSSGSAPGWVQYGKKSDDFACQLEIAEHDGKLTVATARLFLPNTPRFKQFVFRHLHKCSMAGKAIPMEPAEFYQYFLAPSAEESELEALMAV